MMQKTKVSALAAGVAIAGLLVPVGGAAALDGAVNINNPAVCEIDILRLAGNSAGINNANSSIAGDEQSATLDFDFAVNATGAPDQPGFGDIQAGRFTYVLDVVCNAMWDAILSSSNGAFSSVSAAAKAGNGFVSDVEYEVRYRAGSVVNTGYLDASTIVGSGHQMLGLQPFDGTSTMSVRWVSQPGVLAGDDYSDVLILSFALQ